ncbi:unnamed protein product [Hanseniaspora opuntiae]
MSASGIIQARDSCVNNSSYDGYLHLRILSIFMILLSSGLGIFLPLILGSNFLTKKVFTSKKEFSFINVFYFICKNFGQGVIFATSFIHLLQPANEELTGECLSPAWQEYPYAFGICMLSSFSIYLLEIVSRYYIETILKKGDAAKNHGHGLFNVGEILDHGHLKEHGILTEGNHDHEKCNTEVKEEDINAMELGLAKNDDDVTSENSSTETIMKGEAFTHAHELDTLHKVLSVLFVVLVFHQLFEGLGCGTRIAEVEFSGRIKALFGVMYTLTTPISIAIGLGVRSSLNMDSNGMNIVSGVFDSISAGILMYNGFSLLFSSFNDFPGRIGMKLLAYVTTCFGVGIMALLGKWA